MSGDTWNDSKTHAFVNTAFDLAIEQPIRALIVEGYPETRLLLVARHVVLDKAALAALIKRIEDKYLSLQANSAAMDTDLVTKSSRVTASSVTPTYLDWASWSRERLFLENLFPSGNQTWETVLCRCSRTHHNPSGMMQAHQEHPQSPLPSPRP